MAHDTHDHHAPGLQHQFEDMGQQEESVAIGMWMFLAQEIMFFGGLFTAYLVFRSRFPLAFAEASNHLDAFWGGLNTLVLIVSSLTMALTVYYAQRANRNMQVLMIVLTMIFGTVFLGVKVIEYTDKYNSGLVPVTGWNKKVKEGEATPQAKSNFALPFRGSGGGRGRGRRREEAVC
jgi:cytochrome c oxidase subunit III